MINDEGMKLLRECTNPTVEVCVAEIDRLKAELEKLKDLLEVCNNIFERLSYKKQTAFLRKEIAQALKGK